MKAVEAKITLRCNECGKKRKVSPDGYYNERCPKCGGVDWDVAEDRNERTIREGLDSWLQDRAGC